MGDLPAILQQVPELGWTSAQVWAAYRVFGPSLGVFGRALESLSERYSERLLRIVERAEAKLGDKADEEGAVSPRVVHKVLTDGVFSDDPVVHDYFAGMLVASRTEDGEDDSAIPYVQMLARLSSDAIRLHYLLYRAVREALAGGWSLGSEFGRAAAQFHIVSDRVQAVVPARPGHLDGLINQLLREDLLRRSRGFRSEEQNPLTELGYARGAPPEAIDREHDSWTPFSMPSWSGVDLALRAEGNLTASPRDFLLVKPAAEIDDLSLPRDAMYFSMVPLDTAGLVALRKVVRSPGYATPSGWALPRVRTHDL